MDEFWAYDYLINPINVGIGIVIENPTKSPEEILEFMRQAFKNYGPK